MKFGFSLILLFISSVQAASIPEVLQTSKAWNNKVFRSGVRPVWLNDQSFWYRVQTGPNTYEYVRVDAMTGVKKTAVNRSGIDLPERETMKTSESHETEHSSKSGGESGIVFLNRLSEAVQMVWIDTSGKQHDYGKVPPQGEFRQNTYAGHVWMIKNFQEKVLAVVTAKEADLEVTIDGISPAFRSLNPSNSKQLGVKSPDGKWNAWVEDGKVLLRAVSSGEVIQVKTHLDSESPVYSGITWSPDSSCFVISAAAKVPKRQMTLIDSSPVDQVQPKKREVAYPKPGDSLPKPVPAIVRLRGYEYECQVVETNLFPNPFIQKNQLDVRWAPNGEEFYFDYNQRGHQSYRILGVNAKTGGVRFIVDETSQTFIDHTQKTWRHWLDNTGELLWMSERDGWCHLWLYDVHSGQVQTQVTRGSWVVRKVMHVDEEKRQVWFMASGLRETEDPYHEHLCRVNLDGSGFQRLTEADGQHVIEWSPDRSYFLDKWSRADHPPVTELRRSVDGSLVCTLERADVGALLDTGWQMPERWVAHGRDGRTSIHGLLIKPSFFDPKKTYPILEQVYAGPHGAFAPKEFGILNRQHQMAELGFIVVQADGMGTNHRGKKFHDVCWKNLKDAGFPDRIAWIKSAAKTRPWMDLERVGIYGGSAGGQSAMRALLDHHDFYKVAVADCGCHDNRMDKIWWNEQWMGWPVDESYRNSSNVEDAVKLQGELLLIVGELDENVDPSSTYQVVSALQKAGKTFEFMPIIGTGHSAAETSYGSRLRMEFFVKHLRL